MTAVRVEKLMSLTPAEFRLSFGRLDAAAAAASDGRHYRGDLGDGGIVRVAVEPVDPLHIGGLLTLPRCRVTLTFERASTEAAAAFVKRFDLAFQRGGG